MTDPRVHVQESEPVCPDCGKPLDQHCVMWPHDGDMYVQCPFPRDCASLTASGGRCKRRAVWFHHRIGWCSQHAPSYLKEAYRA